MNAIEKQAYLTLKYCADLVVYVFDLTEGSFPISAQEKLYQETLKSGKDVIVYLSKTDLYDVKETKFKEK